MVAGVFARSGEDLFVMFIATLVALASLQVSPPVFLDTLDLTLVKQAWGQPNKNASVESHPLSIGGEKFARGLGTHASSVFIINLRGIGERFEAKVGVDDEVGARGTVRFEVWLDNKRAYVSPVKKGGEEATAVDVELRGAKSMRLVVDEAGDGMDFDHADWADAKISVRPGFKNMPVAVPIPVEPGMKIASGISDKTQIHGPRVVGCTPGHSVLFRIPASGKPPLTYAAESLPHGLVLDGATGIVSGAIATAGTYPVKVTADGKGGADSRVITFLCGKDKLAQTPPMGWNSWNVWATSVDAAKVRAAGEALVQSGLASFGYQYVNIDDAWEGARSPDGTILTNEKFGDMKVLADDLHRMGLKLGIYSGPGPKTCAGYEGSYQHERQDADMYAAWGIDYLKYDWCSYDQIAKDRSLAELQRPYRRMKEALDQCGRDIVYSMCQYGMGDVYQWGRKTGGNLWRTTGDITDTWSSMAGIGFDHHIRSPYAEPGGWNDPDMLVVGRLGWSANPRPTNLTQNEQIVHITLWSLLAAPLILGCDLTKLDQFTLDLLTNHDVIEVDQDPLGKAATRRWADGPLEVWARPLWDGTMAVGLFNRGLTKAKVTVSWADIGLSGAQPVRDLWLRKDIGVATDTFSMEVPSHGAQLIKVGKPKE